MKDVELPEALALPTVEASTSGTSARQPGLHSMALHPDGKTVVGFGWRDGPVAGVARVGAPGGLVDLKPALGELGPMAATFSHDGTLIWLSAESDRGAALLRLSFPSFKLEARATFSPAPPPAAHELFLHPTDDAALLTMACGQDGTFLQVGEMVGEKLALVVTQGEGGVEPCGLADATLDGARVCLVSAEKVALRRWPDLVQEAELKLPEELATNFNGVRIGSRFFISAIEEDEENERAVVLDEALGLVEVVSDVPGMWAGRLGDNRLVTIDRAKGDKRLGYVYSVEG